jgi:hypothetical protein
VTSTEVHAALSALAGAPAADLLQATAMHAGREGGISAAAWFAWALERVKAGETPQSIAAAFGPPPLPDTERHRLAAVDRGLAWLAAVEEWADLGDFKAKDALGPMSEDDVAEAIRDQGGLDETPALFLLDQIRELRRRVTALESFLDGFRHEAQLAITRRNNPGGQQAGTPAWASVPLSICLAVVRDVGHAIGPPKAPGGAP